MYRKRIGAAAAFALGVTTPTVSFAHFVKAPCDFITAGGAT